MGETTVLEDVTGATEYFQIEAYRKGGTLEFYHSYLGSTGNSIHWASFSHSV